MDTIKIFENYGCLGAEKRSVYTAENPHDKQHPVVLKIVDIRR